MSESQRTYEGLLENQNFIDSTYYVLQGLGEDVAYDPKEILDTFLTKKRYFDTNVLSTFNIGEDMKGLDEDRKELLRYSLSEVEKLPMAGSSGGAPVGSAIADYLLAGVTDPTNLLAAVASAFTAGSGGAAIIGAKEAAKQGVKAALKSRVKALVSKPVLKTLAVDGAISGAGGATQSILAQDVEKDIGLKKESILDVGGLDIGRVGVQALAEGIMSPLIGSTVGITGATAKDSVSKLIDQSETAKTASNWLAKNFLPTANLQDSTRRLAERRTGEIKPFADRASEIQDNFKVAAEKESVDLELQNKALENDPDALATLELNAPETYQQVIKFRNLIDETSRYASESALPNEFRNRVFGDNANYVRNVPDAYFALNREPFKKFLENNPNILTDYKAAVIANRNDPRFSEIASKILDDDGRLDVSDEVADKILLAEMKKLYTPTRAGRKLGGPFEGRVSGIPELVKTIIGYNNTPAFRILDSVNAVTEAASKANLASDIANDALNNNLGVIARNAGEASRKLGGRDAVRLIDSLKGTDKDSSVLQLQENLIDSGLKNIFIEKVHADKLKELFNTSPFGKDILNRNDALGTAVRGFLGTQAFAKAGKTVYSPITQVRNFIGAAGYTLSSGNIKGIWNAFRAGGEKLKPYNKLTKKEKSEKFVKEWTEFQQQGLQGSNIDLNQAVNRLQDIADTTGDRSIASKILFLGKPGKIARDVYQASDDIFKFGIYKNEKIKSEKIFDAFSPEKQNELLTNFKREYNIDRPVTKEDYIKEQAAIKTANLAPIYDRIPPILEKLRALPVIGTFTAYPAERLRNTYQVFKTATDEMKLGFETGNKELQKVGAARLLQWYAAQGSVYTAAYAANEIAGTSEVLQNLRQYILPEYQKDDAIVVTRVDKDGNPYIRNLSYLNPDSYLSSIVMPSILKASRGEDVSEDLDKALLKAGEKLLDPFTSPSLALDGASGLLSYIKSGGEDIVSLRSVVKAIEPGFVKLARDMVIDSGALDSKDSSLYDIDKFLNPRYYGETPQRAADFGELLDMNGLALPGLKEEKIDLKKATGFALRQLSSNANSNWSDFNKSLKSTLNDPTAVYEIEPILRDYDEAQKDQYAFQQGLSKLYTDLNYFLPKQKVLSLFRNNIDLGKAIPSKEELSTIFRGRSSPRRLSRDGRYFSDLLQNLREKTNMNFSSELNQLRNNLRQLEKYYDNRDLRREPPDLEIGEE